MTDEERCKFAANIFYVFATSKESRLKYGATKRLEMKKALKNGQKVQGYRAEWILKTVDDIIKTLIKASEKFNNTHFNDMISTDDLKDVLSSTVNKIDKSKKRDD